MSKLLKRLAILRKLELPAYGFWDHRLAACLGQNVTETVPDSSAFRVNVPLWHEADLSRISAFAR